VIAFGHTWSPTLELAPARPLRHGHAIAVDMAYSVTLAHARGELSEKERDEFLDCAAAVGLTLDHEAFDEALLERATEVRAIARLTRCSLTPAPVHRRSRRRATARSASRSRRRSGPAPS
jgi:3-dehydroquinate synthetase